MRTLNISIEANGRLIPVGVIEGDHPDNAGFRYLESWAGNPEAIPISLSLPLQTESFSPAATRSFFEGLLPEGFTRRSVSQWLHADENDYLTILSGLGRECLGALLVTEPGNREAPPSYEKMTMKQVRALAEEGTVKSAELVTESHLSLTGASGKVGLYYHKPSQSWYLPRGTAPSTHIVKQSHARLQNIVTNEQLCFLTARLLGLVIPESFIINTGNAEDADILFATRRYDRIFSDNYRTVDGIPVPLRLHQEDMAQALGIPSSEKYEAEPRGYLAKMCDTLRNFSANPLTDLMNLWKTLIFHYLIGNTDGHIKNFSLLHGANLKEIRLAPSYDIVSTAIYESGTREMSLFIGHENRIDRISRDSFAEAADRSGIAPSIVLREFDSLADHLEHALTEAARQLNDLGFTNAGDIREKILASSGYGYLNQSSGR